MRLALIGYCLGIFAGAFVSEIDPGKLYYGQWIALIVSCLILLAVCLPVVSFRLFLAFPLPGSARRLLITVFAAALGFLWHMTWASGILHQQLPLPLEGMDLMVTGVVVSLPVRNDISQQFKFRIRQSDQRFSRRIILLNYYGEVSISGGQYWRFLVRLNKPHGFANPASFDYEAWLFQQAIAAKGYVRSSVDNQLLATHSFSISFLRSWLRSKAQNSFENLAHGGIILALMLGDRSEISQETWQNLSDAGVNHLFVISGLHISLIALVVFWIADNLVRLSCVCLLRLPAQKFAAISAVLAAVAYSLLAGFTLPTQRALIMIVVFMFGYLSNRPLALAIRYLLALALVMTVNPLAVVSAGFWFSFIAVAALLLCIGLPASDGDQSFLSRIGGVIIHRYLKPQLIVFVALAMPLVFWTGQLPVLSPLINVFAIPLVALLVVPLCLLALIALCINDALAQFLIFIADTILTGFFLLIESILAIFAAGAVVNLMVPTVPIMAGLGFAAVLLLLPRGVANRWLALPLSLPLWLPLPDKFEPASLKLYFLDVGQGLAVVVQTRHHVLIYDTGANLSSEFNIGSAVITPFLDHLGIRQVDRVVISHGDNDHAGGLSGLVANTTVLAINSSTTGLPVSVPVSPCHEFEQWIWDEVEFSFLGAFVETATDNDNSCVLQISAGKHRVLLPGDIERLTEYQLASMYGEALQSTIIAAPHHGSKTSSSYPLIKMVEPQFVVFSTGYRNSFGHPHPEVVARYVAAGARVLTTSDTGMISFTIHKESVAVTMSLFRQQQSRYWR